MDGECGVGTCYNPIVIDDGSSVSLPARSPVKILDGNHYRSFVESFQIKEESGSETTDDEDDDSGTESKLSKSMEDQLAESPESPMAVNSLGIPIFERPPPKYTATRIMQILLNPRIDTSKVAHGRPIEAQRSSTFVVDLTSLKHPDDVKKDMFGRWDYSGSHPEVFRCSFDQFDDVHIEKCAPGATGPNVYYLRRIRSSHPSNSDFRRLIAFVHDHNNQPHRYCLAVYYVPSGFHPHPVPHGNSKSSTSFYPTLPSTMQQMREECKKGSGPKKVISDVTAGVGGIVSSSDSCEIPRNELQVTKLKGRMKLSSLPALCAPGDELGIIMQQAFMEDSSNIFVRDVKCLREPAIIVATERQLNDLVRFCTPSSHFSILTVDPTFCLGDFDVTVITYRHTMLTSRQTGSPQAIIGPLMIHYKKSFATYLYFSSSLISLRRELSTIKCFGTDGEQALVDAFRHACPNSLHLICSIHVRKNTKAKLRDLGVQEGVRNIILDDIFGKRRGCHYSEGLVDAASSKEFDEVFQSLTKKWQSLDLSGDMWHRFIQWFQKHKSGVGWVRNSSLYIHN